MKIKRLGVITGILVALCFAGFAYPSTVLCAFAMDNSQKSAEHRDLVQEARSRINDVFGATKANPVILFFDDENAFWPLKINPYGSTSFLGKRSCVFIGPEGKNVDVTAHEILHAEIAHRIGFKTRGIKWPIWFDEGLAMQVDYREAYLLPENVETEYVRELKSGRDFFVSDNEQLTRNYAASKSEVAQWVEHIGKDSVYATLSRIKFGASFESVIISGWPD